MNIKDKIERIKISDLKEYDKNYKDHPDSQISLLANNIEKFGFTVPLLVNDSNVIIAGHGRMIAAKSIGYYELPCIRMSGLSDAEEKALRIADNRISELAENNIEFLEEEFKLVADEGLDWLTGYSEVDFLVEEPSKDVVDDDYEIPDVVKTDIKVGDIFVLGNHRLMCGDSTDYARVFELVNEKKIKTLFTDPPYNIDYQDLKGKHEKIKNDKMSDEDFVRFIHRIILNANEIGVVNRYICCNWKYYHLFYKAMLDADTPVKACIVWDKERGVQNLDRYHKQHEFVLYNGPFGGQKTLRGDIYRLSRQKSDLHPTMKPVELCADFIQDSTFKEEGVLDLFGGSGSTLIACEQLDRKCYMMELDPKYCQVIIDRWEKFTGNKAEKL